MYSYFYGIIYVPFNQLLWLLSNVCRDVYYGDVAKEGVGGSPCAC